MARNRWTPIRPADKGSNWGGAPRRSPISRRSSRGIYGGGKSGTRGGGRGGNRGGSRSGLGGGRGTYGRSSYGRSTYGRGGRRGWDGLSRTRQRRLIRTGLLGLLILILLVWGLSTCGPDTTSTSTSTTTSPGKSSTSNPSATPNTVPPVAPLNVAAATLPKKLPSAHYQTSAAVADGKVVLIGGLDTTRSSTNVVWRFDPATGATTDLGRIPAARHDTALASVGGSVFAFGGTTSGGLTDSVLVLKPGAANAIDTGSRLPSRRSGAAAVTVEDGTKALIVGGYDGKNPTNDVLATTDGTTFTAVATLAEPVRYPAVAAVGSTVWVFGGIWNDQSTASIQKIDLATGTASVVGTLPAPLSRASAFVLDGSIFVAGGRNANGRTADIARFDPVALTATPVGKLPQPLTDSASAVVGGKAYLLGGATPGATASIVAISPAP